MMCARSQRIGLGEQLRAWPTSAHYALGAWLVVWHRPPLDLHREATLCMPHIQTDAKTYRHVFSTSACDLRADIRESNFNIYWAGV